jgi:hypothetical protein
LWSALIGRGVSQFYKCATRGYPQLFQGVTKCGNVDFTTPGLSSRISALFKDNFDQTLICTG